MLLEGRRFVRVISTTGHWNDSLGLCLVVIIANWTQPAVAQSDWLVLVILFGLYAFTQIFPLRRENHTISLSISVDLLIFYKFGILPVVLISQFLLLTTRWYRDKKIVLPLVLANSGMYLLMHSVAVTVYTWTGGVHGGSIKSNLLPLILYAGVHTLINHLLMYLFMVLRDKVDVRTYLVSTRFDLFSTAFAASLGFIIILLYERDGLWGLLAIGLPTILCVYVFKLFNDVWKSNALFRNLAALTSSYSDELESSAMFHRVTEELPKWFEHVECIIMVRQDKGITTISSSSSLSAEAVTAIQAYVTRVEPTLKGLLLNKRVAEEPELAMLSGRYKNLVLAPFNSEHPETGYCCLVSSNNNQFDATTLDAISILSNHLAVSYRNALRYETVEKQSLYDELTQLPNHRFYERRVNEELMRFEGKQPLSLLLIDLDHFKKINDRYGHLAGNTVLQQLARTFEQCLRRNDFVARYGGEEFIVVLPGSDTETAELIGEKIRSTIEGLSITVPTMDSGPQVINVTVSIGIATHPNDADDALQLLRFADRAMYHGSKRAGRNRVACYNHIPEYV